MAGLGLDKDEDRPIIKIKKENVGTFTNYCEGLGLGGVTSECISKGKASKNPVTKKRAVFAGNARTWGKG